MGILNKFSTPADNTLKNGSKYGPKYTATGDLPTIALASISSPLHAEQNGKEGYSLNGVGQSDVQKLYNEYDDGMVNSLPSLDKLTLDDIAKHKYNSSNVYTNPEFSPEVGTPNSSAGLGPANPNPKP